MSDLRGVEYLRVSIDRSGRERSHGEQHAENVDTFDAIESWATPYRDTGSASRFQRHDRDDFGRLVGDLESNRFDGDVLVLWESSRGSRQVEEWCRLIRLCRERGKLIAVTTHGRMFDPSNEHDEKALLIEAVDAQHESAKTSRRANRTVSRQAAEGRPHGKTPFGYRREYDPRTGQLDRQVPDVNEAPLVVELFERVAAGHSLKSIARDWDERGIRSRGQAWRGGDVESRPFSPSLLSQMAVRPAYAGLRTWTPGGRHRKGQTMLVEGTWEPIVPRELYDTVQNILTDTARRRTRPARAVHLLSMIARCDVCGASVKAVYTDGVRYYTCQAGGHVRVNADELDRWAESRITRFLSEPDEYENLTAEGDPDVNAARAERAEAERELNDLVRRGTLPASDPDRISLDMIARMEPAYRARLDQADARLAEATTPVQLRNLIESGARADVAARWYRADIEVKRQIARIVFSDDGVGIGSLRLIRGPKGGIRVPVTDRITGVN